MIRSHLRADGVYRTGLTREEVHAALRDPAALLWLDIEEAGRGEGESWLRDDFGFHSLTIDDCYNDLVDPPKVDDFGDYLFIIVQAVEYGAETAPVTACELDMYVGPNYVVSFHKRPLTAAVELRRRLEGEAPFVARGADFMAHALFDIVVDEFHPVVERLDDEINGIEEEVIERPDRTLLERSLVVRRGAQRLRRSIMPQRDVAGRFARGEFEHLISRASLMYYRDIYDHTLRVEEMIEAVRDVADSTLNAYLSSLNNRTNEVMKTLAIVTVVFLPLTLIAGIYGTNFDNVAEYKWQYGYSGMLLIMGVVVVLLIAWFRWRRWI